MFPNLLSSFLVSWVLIFALAYVSNGQNCLITKAADSNDGFCESADCSLREAISDSQCTFVNVSPQLAGSTITLTEGEIQVNSTKVIIGLGADLLTISGNNTSRIFFVNARVQISGVTLTGGNGIGIGSGSGGAIRANAGFPLRLYGVNVTGNTTNGQAANGGGVYSEGRTLYIIASTFSNNTASGTGGGVFFSSNPTDDLGISCSTFSSNVADEGMAIHVPAGQIEISHSTVAANGTGDGAIKIDSHGALRFGNSLMYGNDRNLWVSTNNIFSDGGNLIGNSSNTGTAINYSSFDILDANPMLLPLQNNGGRTPTHGLSPNSPAIDAGRNLLSGFTGADQRGVLRIFDGNGDANSIVDIGAVEYLSSSGISISGQAKRSDGRPMSKAVVKLLDARGHVRHSITSTFGYYKFFNVPGNEQYTISPTAKTAQYYSFSTFLTYIRDDIDFNAISSQLKTR